MMAKKEKFLTYLKEEKAACVWKEQELIQDERKDEANLVRVQMNIYDIFGALFNASVKEITEEGMVREVFGKKAETIPSTWKQSLELAKAHDDVKKIVIEETKLKEAKKIWDAFERIWEESK